MSNITVRNAWHAYRSSAIAQAIAKNGVLMLALVCLDVFLHPHAGRLLYVIPVFGVTRVAGVRVGVIFAVFATVAGTLLDRAGGLRETWLLNSILRFVAYAVVAFKVEGMVDRLKITTEAAMHDALTGAFNRLGYVQAAEASIRDALLADTDVVLAVIDLNDFKQVNDLYGHTYGDKVLKTLVGCLAPAIAAGGLIGRTGGDEFQVLFTGATEESVQKAIDRSMNRFADATLVLGHRSTFSYGIASLGGDGTGFDALVQCADSRMYRHKSAKPPSDGRHAVIADYRRVQKA